MFSEDGLILQTNTAFDKLFGYESGELVGKSIFLLTPYSYQDNTRIFREFIEHSKKQGSWYGELNTCRKDKTRFDTYAQISPVEAAGGQYWLRIPEDNPGRNLTQETLPHREALEKIVMNISGRFINLDLGELDQGLNSALQSIGEAMAVDHGYIYLFSDDRRRLTRTHEWCSTNSNGPLNRAKVLLEADFPWLTEKIKHGEVVSGPRLTALPPAARSEKESLEANRCQSCLLIPLMYTNNPVGVLGFESVLVEKTWPKEIIALLKIVGAIFTNALERRRMDRELQQVEEKYRNLVENINEVIFSMDAQGCFNYVSPVVKQITFYSAEEMMGQPLAYLIHPDDLPAYLSALQRTLAGQSESHEFRILNKEGSMRHIKISTRRVLEGDQPVGLAGLMSDITEQKWAELLVSRAEEKYRSIFENAVEGIFQSTLDGRFIVANPACARIFGYSSVQDLIVSGAPRKSFVDQDRYRDFQRQLEEHGTLKGFEAQAYRLDGSKIWISLNTLAIRDPQGVLVFYEGTIEDITERKWTEEQIRYLSFHDKLTGLYNRAYFEEELKRLDTERQLPISLIMGDVNGLKLVNDAFGHQEGDKLLMRIAAILRESCRKEDVVARFGGDEFAIFLPRTSFEVTMEIVSRISQACSQANPEPVKLSISLGAVTKEDPSQDILEILKESEERMYRSKLLESKDVRDSIISSLQRTLFERNHESEEHTHRLQELAKQMGRTLALSDSVVEELILLATLHDIGNITIPEGVIAKPDSLSAEERELIWKHPEVGYHIAGSSPELATIAEAILAHHEWWDGSGYPRKLKGEDIPLNSRIIAIIDAYDVMTHEQPYKKPMSQKEALQELRKKSGTQFDPILVDQFIKMVTDAL